MISEEEYLEALNRLTFINQERNLLKSQNKDQIYFAHINLPDTFGELLIDLNRQNFIIDQQIEHLKKDYLEKYKSFPNSFSMFDECVHLIESKLENVSSKDINPTFPSSISPFVKELEELLEKRHAQQYLLDYIKNLEKEEIHLKKIVSKYEKQSKRKTSIFPFKR